MTPGCHTESNLNGGAEEEGDLGVRPQPYTKYWSLPVLNVLLAHQPAALLCHPSSLVLSTLPLHRWPIWLLTFLTQITNEPELKATTNHYSPVTATKEVSDFVGGHSYVVLLSQVHQPSAFSPPLHQQETQQQQSQQHSESPAPATLALLFRRDTRQCSGGIWSGGCRPLVCWHG